MLSDLALLPLITLPEMQPWKHPQSRVIEPQRREAWQLHAVAVVDGDPSVTGCHIGRQIRGGAASNLSARKWRPQDLPGMLLCGESRSPWETPSPRPVLSARWRWRISDMGGGTNCIDSHRGRRHPQTLFLVDLSPHSEPVTTAA